MNPEFLPLDLPPRAAGPLALAHVTVVPMDSERRIANQTVVIDNGLIQSLGNGNVKGIQTLDCSGLYLMPGLADMYTHYWDPVDAPLYLAAGITLVRTVGTPFQLALERVAERGEFAGPRMVTISPPIDGVGANGRTDMPRGVAMTRPEHAAPLAERFARGGYRQIKAFSLLTPENLVALCRAAPVRVTANCPNAMTFEEAIEAGVYCFDQLHNIARGHMLADAPQPQSWDRFDPVPGTRLDPDAIRRVARLMAKRQVWNVPTLVFHQRDGLTPEQGMGNPALKYVPRGSIQDWESTLVRWTRRARMDTVEEWRSAARERARAFLEVVRIFHEEGVPLLTGSDSLNPWNVPGESLHAELENFVAAGMTPYQALRCATSEAARFIGDGAAGSVAVGKRADLVLTRSDPLRDVRALRDIEAVFVNGYYLPRADLDRMLAQRAAMAASPPTLPSVNLPEATGVWLERIVGTECGRIAYRHSRLPDRGWLIDEVHATSVPRRHTERRSCRLELDRDFKLRACSYRVDSFAGEETAELTYSSGGYAIRFRDVDGWVSEGRLAAEPLLPSERLTLTLWPLLLSRLEQAGSSAVLDLDGGSLAAREAQLDPREGKLAINRPTHLTEQRYRLGPDGGFRGMQEVMPLLWLRELAPLAQ